MKEMLRTLYQKGLDGTGVGLTMTGLIEAVAKGWITLDDVVDIVGEDSSTNAVMTAKVKEISTACGEVIVAGVDVPVDDRIDHFNLSIEDQSNISNLYRVVELGGTEFPYQADDGQCVVYSATDITKIYVMAQTLITSQTAYHNALKNYVQTLTDKDVIAEVFFGMELPEPYASEVQANIDVAAAQLAAITSGK